MSGQIKPPPSLSLVRGTGIGNGDRRGALVALEVPPRQVPHQLGLLSLAEEPARIISLGMDALDFESFRCVLHDHSVRRVVDIRLLAAFRGRGFNPAKINAVFEEFNICYERLPEIGNRFIGVSRNKNVVLERYAMHLRSCAEPLHRLKTWIDQGPVVLLGRNPEHSGSEREVVVHALANLESSSGTIIISTCDLHAFARETVLVMQRKSKDTAASPDAGTISKCAHRRTKKKLRRRKRTGKIQRALTLSFSKSTDQSQDDDLDSH